MASEILGLFTSPEEYQMRQQQAQQNRALQFAQLNPFEKANYGIYQGAQQLGGATAGLFGMEDPQLRKISMRQQMITGAGGAPRINMNDPESIRRAALIAQEQGDPEFAISLNDYARKAESEMALIQQRTKEGRAAAIPKELQLAQTRADLNQQIVRLEREQIGAFSQERADALTYLKDTLAGLKVAERQGQIPDVIEIAREQANLQGLQAGTPEYSKFVNDRIEKLSSKADKVTAYGSDRNAIAQGEFNKDFADLTQEQKKAVNAIADQEKRKVAEAGATKLPGQDKAGVKGISEFRDSVINTVKPFRNTVTSADQAIQSINDSLKTGNFISFNAARTQLAKALGDGTLSRRDVEQAGGDPSILGGLADTASTMFTGTPTADTQRKIKSTLLAIRKVAREKGASEIDIQKQIAQQSGYDDKQMKVIFNFPEFEKKAGGTQPITNETIPENLAPKTTAPVKGQPQTRTLKSGKKVTVEME